MLAAALGWKVSLTVDSRRTITEERILPAELVSVIVFVTAAVTVFRHRRRCFSQLVNPSSSSSSSSSSPLLLSLD